MKKLLSLLIVLMVLAVNLAQSQVSKARRFVNDRAGVLDPHEIQRLESKVRTYQLHSGNEIAVLLVKSIGGRSIENYAHQVFQKWGIGLKGKDNGVLFLAVIDQRKARIEVGYGLEEDLTDIEAGRLVSNISPMAMSFRSRLYAEGIEEVFDGIVEAIDGEYGTPEVKEPLTLKKIISLGFVGLLFVIIVLVLIYGRKGGNWKSGGSLPGGRSGGSYYFGGGSGFGGGGFSGGGGGFGGGSSGGGGASGGW
jgi:uncharacterized protein